MPQTQRWCHHSNRQYTHTHIHTHTSAGMQREWMGRIWLIATQWPWRLIARLWLMWQAIILPAQAEEMKKGPDGRYFWAESRFLFQPLRFRCDYCSVCLRLTLKPPAAAAAAALGLTQSAAFKWSTGLVGPQWHMSGGWALTLFDRIAGASAQTKPNSPPQLPLHSLWTSTPIFPQGWNRWHDYHYRVIIKCSRFPEIELRNNHF